jgi:hypothetical protein
MKGKKPRPSGSSGSSGQSGMGGRKSPPPRPRPAAPPPPKARPATPPPPKAKPATPPPPRPAPRPATRPATPPSTPGTSPLRGQAARERLARRANTAVRPLPPPPNRRPVSGNIGNRPPVQTQNAQLQAQIQGVFNRYAQLESEAQLSDVYEAIGQVDTRLTQLPLALEGLRQRGFVHGGRLEEQIAAFDEQWDNVRPRVEDSLQDHVQRLNYDMDQAEQHINRLSGGSTVSLSAAESAVNGLAQKIQAARSGVRGLFGNLEGELGQIDYNVGRIEWMLDQFDASQEVRLADTEGPLAAVEAEWMRDGDEGPDGILFLTDQRLIFEQKEEVVTKKFLGLFKTDSETVQRLLLNVPIHEIEKVEHGEEGGFLGMGKKDMLDLVLSSNQPVSRARFHLQGQDSSDWATYIKQVQTGEINRDRDEDYVEALQQAEATAASFPTQCPNCFAPVPTPPRGAPSVVCEFCGTVIMPAAQ